MNVITVSREHGAGGEEVAQGLARVLAWEVLDRELMHQAAHIARLPEAQMEQLDEQPAPKGETLSSSLVHQQYIRALTEAAVRAAERGKVILVGRGARHLLGEARASLHLRLVGPKAWRAQRIALREGLSTEKALARCNEIDRARRQYTHFYFGDAAIQPAEYHLVVNSARLLPEDLVPVVAALVQQHTDLPGEQPRGRRVLTLSRELGAGDSGFAPTLGERLGLKVADREILDQEAVRMGVPKSEVEYIDEQPATGAPGAPLPTLHRRYFEALQQIILELAEQGETLIVGRGGSCFLRDYPWAFHVKLVAPMAVRKRRVSEHRWLREETVRKLIADSDLQRRGFYQTYFKADWDSPLESDITVNSGRLGPAAIDLVALAATRHWQRIHRAAQPG